MSPSGDLGVPLLLSIGQTTIQQMHSLYCNPGREGEDVGFCADAQNPISITPTQTFGVPVSIDASVAPLA